MRLVAFVKEVRYALARVEVSAELFVPWTSL